MPRAMGWRSNVIDDMAMAKSAMMVVQPSTCNVQPKTILEQS